MKKGLGESELVQEPEIRHYVVRVVWDTSLVEEKVYEIRISADQVAIETELGQEKACFSLLGKSVLEVPITNLRGYEEER